MAAGTPKAPARTDRPPEWHVPIRVAEIARMSFPLTLAADAAVRSALARRFDLLTLDRLEAEISLTIEGAQIALAGRFTAALSQACVASGEPVRATLSEPLALIFADAETIAAAEAGAAAEEAGGLDADACDLILIEAGMIDVGEAIAQSLALALNPYPRSAGADAYLRAHGVLREEEAGAFGALAALRDKLGGA